MKVRFRFSKVGKVRWISHRDVARVWERGLRRAGLPVAYTAGFSPRPKVSFGLALPTGAESDAEYLDVELDVERVSEASLDVDDLPARLSPLLPVGLDVTAAAAVGSGADSLQQAVTSCRWLIDVARRSPDELGSLVDAALAADTLVVTRPRKGHEVTDDLRPSIVSLAVEGPGPRGSLLAAELRTQPRGTRPAELLAALGPGLDENDVRRTHQWITGPDGARHEPMAPAAVAAPPAEARA